MACDDCEIFALLGRELLGWGKETPDISQYPIFYRLEDDGYVEQCPWAELNITPLPIDALGTRNINDLPRLDYFTQPEYEDGGLTARVCYVYRLVATDQRGQKLRPYMNQKNLILKKIDNRWTLLSAEQGPMT